MGIKRYKVRNTKYCFLFLVPLTLYLVLLSCAPKEKNPPPPDLINETEMVSVITDLTLSEAALTGEPLAAFNDTLKRIHVLKEHNLDNEHFLSSFKYYTEHPAKLKVIYDSVIVSLTAKRDGRDTATQK